MKRDNHYEAAFEAYLRARGVGYLAVDEARRSLLGDGAVKSLDFVVVGPDPARLVIDVKGRRFPGGATGKPARKVWENWSTVDDVDGLSRWATTFGSGFRGVLAFVYHVLPCVRLPADTPDLFEFHDGTYLMRAVEVDEYRSRMKRRSRKWGTVHLAADGFRECIRPFSSMLRQDDDRRGSEVARCPGRWEWPRLRVPRAEPIPE